MVTKVILTVTMTMTLPMLLPLHEWMATTKRKMLRPMEAPLNPVKKIGDN
jgi:hypothetical protein